jgi:hypothetical protein
VSLPAEGTRVLRAFAYLRAMTFVNALKHRLRRLRQPKYLIGAAIMVAYVGLFFVGPMLMARPGKLPWSPDLLATFSGIAALGMLVAVATAWLTPGDRAALAFSEAEVAFLFPAPLTRVALINFSLLRSQITIFLSAFLLSLLFGRGRGLPGNAWQHATGLWLVMATLRLHVLGASFVHERLFAAGWRPWLRRTVGGLVLLGVVGGVVGWIATHVHPPAAADFANAVALGRWLRPIIEAPPAGTVLAPFRWVVAPMFTGGSPAWGWSLLPAFALLGLHYLWVVRAHVAFEEASIDRARRSAERVQAVREGRSPFRTGAATKQRAPFALAPRGFAPVAFLWSGLIAAGPSGRPRNALIVVAVLAAITFGLAQTPWRIAVEMSGGVAMTFAAFMPLMGPMVAQRSLRDTLDRLDILKAMPLPGWQVALGQLLAPVALITAVQWLLLLVAGMAIVATNHVPSGSLSWAGTFALVLLSPPLAMLILCVPFAGLLWFPAWAGAISARGGGFEVAGQRLVYGFMFMLVLFCALLPAGLVGGGIWLLGGMAGFPLAGMLLGSVAATAVVAAETKLVLRGLGHRIERIDLSSEAR